MWTGGTKDQTPNPVISGQPLVNYLLSHLPLKRCKISVETRGIHYVVHFFSWFKDFSVYLLKLAVLPC